MPAVAARTPARRRGGRRILIALVIVVLIFGGALVWLNKAAQAAVSANAILTVYQPDASVSHGSNGSFSSANTSAVVQAGDVVKTDTKGRAALTLPDGTITRLASDTTVTLDAAHFAKDGNLHDVKLTQQVGRTFTNVHRLVSGATFQVVGKSATATVRGTKFEVYIKTDGSMLVKLFEGELDFETSKGKVHLVAPQQIAIDANGVITGPGPIVPDPTDPFGPAMAASDAVSLNTTPGTEQDYIGKPLHNGEEQRFTYSYAGGSRVKAALGYPGSLMKLTVQGPDGQKYPLTGPSPIVVTVNNAPAGIYTIIVNGVSGLGTLGEEPYVAVASVETCASADVDGNGAVHRGYTAQDLMQVVQVSGLSNLKLTLGADSTAGAIISGSGTYNGVGWNGAVVLVAHNGSLDITPVGGNVFGLSVPAQQIVQQVAAAIGQNPSNVRPGFVVDRLFTCKSVLIVDGRHAT
jgi:hypothetical protein